MLAKTLLRMDVMCVTLCSVNDAEMRTVFVGVLQIVLSHSRLLEQWRHRAAGGQMEARRVLAEMLTPSGMPIDSQLLVSAKIFQINEIIIYCVLSFSIPTLKKKISS